MYRRGLGVELDRKEAYVWSVVAAIQGDKTAELTRDQLLYSLSHDDLDSALARADEILQKLKASRPRLGMGNSTDPP